MNEFFVCQAEVIKSYSEFYKWKVVLSLKFCHLVNKQLSYIIKSETGLVSSSSIGIAGAKSDNKNEFYEKGIVSKLNLILGVMAWGYDFSLCWRSKTGPIVTPEMEDFDEADLEFWAEGLEPEKYWAKIRELNADLPLRAKDYPFALEFTGFAVCMDITISLSDESRAAAIVQALYTLLEKHEAASEKKDGALGFVHNFGATIDGKQILFRLDSGSAGFPVFKKLLKTLAKFPEVEKVAW